MTYFNDVTIETEQVKDSFTVHLLVVEAIDHQDTPCTTG